MPQPSLNVNRDAVLAHSGFVRVPELRREKFPRATRAPLALLQRVVAVDQRVEGGTVRLDVCKQDRHKGGKNM